jgi:N-methylhydantoinase A
VTVFEAAHGVLDVVNTNMERALRHVSVERGNDPRQFSLVPFGGAGGLHAVALARALRIPRIIVPALPGALSAKGVLTADVVKDQSRTVMLAATRDVGPKLERVFSEIEKRARLDLLREGFAENKQRHERSLAVRYQGQSFELQIKQTSGNIAAACHRAHRARYGYARENDVVEIVSARVRSIGVVDKLKEARLKPVVAKGFTKPHDLIQTFFNRNKVSSAVYQRDDLAAGSSLRVPCVVTEYSATTLISEGCKARIDSLGNMIIEVGNTGQ